MPKKTLIPNEAWGDYRKKINENFDEVYEKIGDIDAKSYLKITYPTPSDPTSLLNTLVDLLKEEESTGIFIFNFDTHRLFLDIPFIDGDIEVYASRGTTTASVSIGNCVDIEMYSRIISGIGSTPIWEGADWTALSLENQFSGTYDEIKQLKERSKLIPGNQYLLTDFKNKYNMEITGDLKESDSVERLVLTATSPCTFNINVQSLDFPNDIIYYDFDDVTTESGDSRKGLITRRRDSSWSSHEIIRDNFCYRTTLFPRYRIQAPEWILGTPIEWGEVWSYNGAIWLVRTGHKMDAGETLEAIGNKYVDRVCEEDEYVFATTVLPAFVRQYVFDLNDYKEALFMENRFDLESPNVGFSGSSLIFYN